MSFPVELGYGVFKINAHLLFESLAFILGYQYYVYLRNKSKDVISSENRLWILIGAALGALIGSRLIGSLETPSDWIQSKYPILYFYQNKTIMGGLFGGLIGVEVIKKIVQEPNSSGDLFTLPIIFAIIIGRIGCFLNGVYEPTYGIETDMPWGLDLGDGKFRHPIALYEILFLSLLWCFFNYYYKLKKFKSGILFQLFMIIYFSFRFLIEFIKPSIKIIFHLSTIQLLCIITLLYYNSTIYSILFKRKKIHDEY